METKLKIGKSFSFVSMLFLSCLLCGAMISCLIFGVFDFRTEEERIAEEQERRREEVISQKGFSKTLDTVRYLSRNSGKYGIDIEIKKVYYLPCSDQELVSISYNSSLGSDLEMCFAYHENALLTGPTDMQVFRMCVATMTAEMSYSGGKSKLITYEGEDLTILLTEAGWMS